MSNWLVWPVSRHTERYAACKFPGNQDAQEKLIDAIANRRENLPGEKELVELSEKHWESIEGKCGQDRCKTIALDIINGKFPFENVKEGYCPGCGQVLKRLPFPAEKDSGWECACASSCIRDFTRTIIFSPKISSKDQHACIYWIMKYDNPGWCCWQQVHINNIWELKTTMDSSG